MKKAKHELSGWAMFTKCSFDKKENKLDYCRREDCIEKLCKKLKECAVKIINYEKKEIIPFTYKKNRLYKEQEARCICEEKFCWIKMMKIIKIKQRLKINVITQENLEELLITNAI